MYFRTEVGSNFMARRSSVTNALPQTLGIATHSVAPRSPISHRMQSMPINLTVERQSLSFDSDSIGIGRSPDNQLAFPNDVRVAPMHATLKSVNGRWIIESREGGPIRVGNGRPTQFAWVKPGDTIYLTESGPEIVFDLSPTDGQNQVVSPQIPATNRLQATVSPASQLVSQAAVSKSSPVMPPVPSFAGNPLRVDKDDVSNQGQSKSRPRSESKTSSREQQRQNPIPIMMALTTGAVICVVVGSLLAVWLLKPQTPVANESTTVVNESTAVAEKEPPVGHVEPQTATPPFAAAPIPQPEHPSIPPAPAGPRVEPQEFLVLVGFADLSRDDRPQAMCVGWLWDQRTVVVSREVGKVIEKTEAEARSNNHPAQACVIQGTPVGIEQISYPERCPGIALLKMKAPVQLTVAAREQWQRVGHGDVEKRRMRGKAIRYVSYEALPFQDGRKLCEFNPETCRQKEGLAHLEFDARQHFFKSTDSSTPLERGGLLVDEQGKILGMTVADSSVIWTEALERAFDVR